MTYDEQREQYITPDYLQETPEHQMEAEISHLKKNRSPQINLYLKNKKKSK